MLRIEWGDVEVHSIAHKTLACMCRNVELLCFGGIHRTGKTLGEAPMGGETECDLVQRTFPWHAVVELSLASFDL